MFFVGFEHVLELVLARNPRKYNRGSCRWPCAAARLPPRNRRRPKVRARPCRRPASRAVRARWLPRKLSDVHSLLAAADACDEVFQQLRAVGRMVHFGVELDAPRLLALDVERRDAHVFRAGDDLIVRRNRRDRIAVRHPYLRGFGQAAHQRVVSIAHREHGAAVFTAGGGLHLAAEGRCEELRAVADAQQGQLPHGRKDRVSERSRPGGEGTARQNHTPHRSVERRNLVEGVDFAMGVNSRTRRAMSCVYCEPKSRIRIFSII